MYHGALGFLTVGISIGNGDWNRGHFAIFRKFAGVKELKHVADINHVCNERKPCRNSSIAFRTFPVRSISSSEMASEQRSHREWFGGSCALRPLVYTWKLQVYCYMMTSPILSMWHPAVTISIHVRLLTNELRDSSESIKHSFTIKISVSLINWP